MSQLRARSPHIVPKLVRHLCLHAAFGALLGCALAGALLAFDTSGLGKLFAGTESPWAASLLLFGSFALTFASLVMGSSIMLLPHDETFPEE